MRIPNKFNGYSADNRRLYNDPATLTALTAAGAEGSMVAAPALAEAATLPGIVGGAGAFAPELMTGLASTTPQIAGTASTLAEASPEIASNLASGNAQGIMQGAQQLPGAGGPPSLEEMQAMGQNFAANSPGAGSPDMAQQLTAGPGAPNQIGAPPSTGAELQANIQSGGIQSTGTQTAFPQDMPAAPPESGGILDAISKFTDPLTSGFQKAMDYAKEKPLPTAMGLYGLSKLTEKKLPGPQKYKGSSFNYNAFNAPVMNRTLYGANGGIMHSYDVGGPVEQMSKQNSVGANTGYPMAGQQTYGFTPQRPISQNMLDPEGEQNLDPYTGEPKFNEGGMTDFKKMLAKQEKEREAAGEVIYQRARAKVEDPGIVSRPLSESSTDPYSASINRMKNASKVAGIKMYEMPKINMPESFSVTEAANGGIMHGLGGYSDGGRLLKGPGDGVSDSIPAVIGNKQPARLADGEFVVPARIVSELGNGSTEAGARKLYAMMERIQKGRSKSVGKGKVAVNSRADKHLPA